MDKGLDILSFFSTYLAILNLYENREQSAHNDVSVANDKQAQYLLSEIDRKFNKQNEMLKKIIKELEESKNERNQRNDMPD